ncbi:MAG: carbon-nitrogen hydrolase family protein [Thiohalomonadaceae bacterium]
MPLRIAAAQYPLDRVADWDAYARKLAAWVNDAAGRGARLLVFPEYGALELAALTAVENHADVAAVYAALQERVPHFLDLHRELAVRHGVYILAGSLPVRQPDGRYRNRAHFFAPSGAHGHQDKLLLTRFELAQGIMQPGEHGTVFDTAFGAVGVCICYDSEFPLIARAQVEAGARLLLVPSCTDGMAGYQRVHIACRARALENQCIVVQSPTVGAVDWMPVVDENVGAAGVYAPPDRYFPDDGILACGNLNEPCWVLADVDLRQVERVRAQGQVGNHADWTDSQRAMPIQRQPLAQ